MMSEDTMGYEACRLCPRACGVDRSRGERGFCQMGALPVVASAGIHRGEEPPISYCERSFTGSGTIFFSGCTLGCLDCQNLQISCGRMGSELSIEELAQLMLLLQQNHAANINLVTATQFAPSIREAVLLAGRQGLSIPVLWNSSGFETLELIEYLEPIVDIYLPDLKSLRDEHTQRRCNASSYPLHAKRALKAMAESKRQLWEEDRLLQGVVLRHLVIPQMLEDTFEVLSWYASELMDLGVLLSVMVQYIPPSSHKELFIDEADYERLLDMLDELGIEEGFIQECGNESVWAPDFTRVDPFPKGFYDPVYHYSSGPIVVPTKGRP